MDSEAKVGYFTGNPYCYIDFGSSKEKRARLVTGSISLKLGEGKETTVTEVIAENGAAFLSDGLTLISECCSYQPGEGKFVFWSREPSHVGLIAASDGSLVAFHRLEFFPKSDQLIIKEPYFLGAFQGKTFSAKAAVCYIELSSQYTPKTATLAGKVSVHAIEPNQISALCADRVECDMATKHIDVRAAPGKKALYCDTKNHLLAKANLFTISFVQGNPVVRGLDDVRFEFIKGKKMANILAEME